MSFFIDNDNNIVQSAPGNNSNLTIDPQTGYLIVLGTGGVQLPSGTTAQRPSVSTGVIRYNTSTGFFEGYNINATAWQPFQGYFGILNSLGALATNGIIVNNGGTASTVTITAGTAISVTNGSGTGGNPTITNTGVTSNVAGTGISVSGATGAVTISNTGVLSITGTANQITASASTGAVTLSLPSTLSVGAVTATSLTDSGLTANSFLYSGTAGLLTTSAAPTNGQLLIGSTGAAPVSATLTAGTAIGITNGAGSITINNTGVTSAVAGTGISVSAATGAVTFTNTGVTSIAGTANQITMSASTGAVTASLPANVTITSGLTVSGLTANSFLYSGTAGLLTTTAAPTNGQLLIGSTGAAPSLATLTAGTNISISNTAGAITINTSGVQPALQLYKENPSSPNALTATGTNAVAIGNGASATQTNSMAVGSGSTTEWVTEHALGGSYYSTAGDSKLSFSVATCQTTNATATEIGFNTSSGAPSSYVVPAINSSYYFEVIVTAHRTDVAGTRFCEKLEFLFDKGATSSTAVIVGAPLSTIIARDLAAITSGWAVAISADATNGRPAIKVTGAASQTIRWVAQIRAVKVT